MPILAVYPPLDERRASVEKIRFFTVEGITVRSLIAAMSAATEEKAETPKEEASVADDTAGADADPPEKPSGEKVKGVVNWFNVAKGFGASSWLSRHPACSSVAILRTPPGSCERPREGASIRRESVPCRRLPSPVFFPDRRRGARSSARLETRTPPWPSPAHFLRAHMQYLCGTASARAGLGARPARFLIPGAPLANRWTHSEEPHASSRAGNPREPSGLTPTAGRAVA